MLILAVDVATDECTPSNAVVTNELARSNAVVPRSTNPARNWPDPEHSAYFMEAGFQAGIFRTKSVHIRT